VGHIRCPKLLRDAVQQRFPLDAPAGRALGSPLVQWRAGERVRVKDAGRFGELGMTNILDEVKNYQVVFGILELTDFWSLL
jgi:hypothetical protein